MNQNTMIENDILLVIEDIINKVESEFIPTDKNERNNFITGSVVSHALGLMGQSARKNLLIEKASNGTIQSFFGCQSTHFGNIYEVITKYIYEKTYDTKINEFNQIKHDKIEFLAASTDGVTDELINIEIKALFSRNIKVGKVKKEYYHQTQLQMECLNINLTHFIESKYSSIIDSDTDIDLKSLNRNGITHGIIIEVYNIINKSLEYIYIYDNSYNIINDEIKNNNDLIFIRDIYWKLEEFYVQEIKRDKNWLTDNLSTLSTFWEEVKYYRNNPDAFDSIKTKKTIITDNICLL